MTKLAQILQSYVCIQSQIKFNRLAVTFLTLEFYLQLLPYDFSLIVFYAVLEVTRLFEEIQSADSFRVRDTEQVSAGWLCDRRKAPAHCHRENLQDYTLFHFAGFHNGNGFREPRCAGTLVCKRRPVLRRVGNVLLGTTSSGIVVVTFFRAKVLRTGGTPSAAGAFVRRVRPAAFRKFSRASKIGVFRPHPLNSRLSYPPFGPQCRACTKNGSPDHEAQRGFTKGKRIETLKTM